MSALLKTKLNTLAGRLSRLCAEEDAGASFLEGVCQDLQFQHIPIIPAGTSVHPAGAHTHSYIDDGVWLPFYKPPVFRNRFSRQRRSVFISLHTVTIHARPNCCGKHSSNYWCQYGVMGRQGRSIVANLVHSEVALLWLPLMGRQCFMAGSGFSEACRRRRM